MKYSVYEMCELINALAYKHDIEPHLVKEAHRLNGELFARGNVDHDEGVKYVRTLFKLPEEPDAPPVDAVE